MSDKEGVKIAIPADIGSMVRAKRKQIKLTQVQTSAMCNVGTRFLSELENGKTTLELGKVLHVLGCLGLEVSISPKQLNSAEMCNRQETSIGAT